MAGNSQRKGAIVKPGTKKGQQVGSGGNRRQKLEGKGPTPKATERPSHPAKRRADYKAEQAEKAADPKSRGRAPSRGGSKRRSGDSEIVAGRNPVVEALNAKVPATTLHIQRFLDADPRVKQAMAMALESGVAIKEHSRGELDILTDGVLHQGLALTTAPYEYYAFEDLLSPGTDRHPALLVALDGVTDPRNLGAIARSAAAFGGTGLILPSRRSATVTSTAWRTSAGALAHLPVAQVTNLSRSLDAAKKAGFTVVGLAGDGEVTIEGANLESDPVLLVVGGEGKGLGQLVSQTCDIRASIPIAGHVESLNAGVAASIALYSVVQGRPPLT